MFFDHLFYFIIGRFQYLLYVQLLLDELTTHGLELGEVVAGIRSIHRWFVVGWLVSYGKNE